MTPAHAWQQLNRESSTLGLPSHLSTLSESQSYRPWSMANYVHVSAMAILATLLLCLPRSSVCARAVGAAATTARYKTIASPMSTCPTSNNGASATCCGAFNAKACQYREQVNDFGSLCPMMFINYLGAAGPYPAGYFVGPCGDGSKGFCIH